LATASATLRTRHGAQPYAVFLRTAAGPPVGSTVGSPAGGPGPSASVRVRRAVRALRDFYREPVAWVALFATSLLLCYGGGALMFWFHAIALGEGGPSISWYTHWLLDSTFAFVGLTPALFVIIPFASWAAGRLAEDREPLLSWTYVGVAGGLFAVATVPGPIAHDLVVGRGTWLADRATALFGDTSTPPPPAAEYPVLAELTQQLGFAVPTYLLAVAVSLVVVRALVRVRVRVRARRPGAATPGAG
jgi:hypothetical protein